MNLRAYICHKYYTFCTHVFFSRIFVPDIFVRDTFADNLYIALITIAQRYEQIIHVALEKLTSL